MSEELLRYYQRELAFVRRMGAEFAESYPKIAGRLRIGPDSVEDPNVSRLIEAFALIAARIRHKLDDDFPELSDALLETLYPHYLSPTPSMAIVQFEPKADLTAPYVIKAKTPLESDPIEGEPCRFQTRYPVTLWPVRVTAASLKGRPVDAPAHPEKGRAAAVLRLSLSTFAPDLPFKALAPDSLVFHIAGQAQEAFPIYQLIMNDAIGLCLADSAADPEPAMLEVDAIRPAGMATDQGMVDYPAQAFSGYRLLSEFFAFPDKFLFFELSGIGRHLAQRESSTVEVFVYLKQMPVDIERALDRSNFALGCTPIVNLFDRVAEPIRLSRRLSEYRVVPDARRGKSAEVYAIRSVTASAGDDSSFKLEPFNAYTHRRGADREAFWQATRQPAAPGDPATEVFLRVVDMGFDPFEDSDWTLEVATTCLNRDLPARLPFGGGQPRLHFGEGDAPVQRISCLTAPTPTLRPALRKGAVWRLISHLNLNHLSLTAGEQGGDALREILRLYDFRDSEGTRDMIDGVSIKSSAPVVRRSVQNGLNTVCHGIEIGLELDEAKFTGNNAFLFATILERFLGLYVSVNAFTQLVATVSGREGVLRRWPPRAGSQTLI